MTSMTPCGSTKTVLHLLTISLLLKVLGSDGLRDVRLETKRYIRIGEDALLRCSYDLESETLYAVKWYRGQEEFYRFIPKELRSRQVFPVPGISVDFFQSDDHHVILKNVSFDTNGRYKCVVSVDGSFQTLSDSKDIGIVAIGYDSPRLYLEKLHYRPGDTGAANCTVDKTSPPLNITWFINDKLVFDDKIITRIVEDDKEPRLTTTISMLLFRVPNQGNQPMFIKCVGQLYDVYFEASVTKIQPRGALPSRKVKNPDSLQHSCAQASIPAATRLLTTILLQILSWLIFQHLLP